MKKLVSMLLLTFLTVASLSWANHEESEPSDGTVGSFRAVEPPMPVPPITMIKNNMETLGLEAFRGKIVLLNLWATWCPPCIRELPALDRLQQRQGGADFVVIALAVDRAEFAEVKAFYDKLNLNHLDLYQGEADNVSGSFPIDVFPASFFIDRDGNVLSYLRSFADWDAPEADRLVQYHKAQKTH
ncbi:MAG: TlpA disulfide reductase family protein [Motiliproteus sp.]